MHAVCIFPGIILAVVSRLLIRNGHWRVIIVRQEYDVKTVMVGKIMLPSSLMVRLKEDKVKANL